MSEKSLKLKRVLSSLDIQEGNLSRQVKIAVLDGKPSQECLSVVDVSKTSFVSSFTDSCIKCFGNHSLTIYNVLEQPDKTNCFLIKNALEKCLENKEELVILPFSGNVSQSLLRLFKKMYVLKIPVIVPFIKGSHLSLVPELISVGFSNEPRTFTVSPNGKSFEQVFSFAISKSLEFISQNNFKTMGDLRWYLRKSLRLVG